ncbi:Fic family protein, partial [Streptococcus pyogenes]
MKSPFTVTNTMLNKVVEISKIIGNLELQVQKDL